MTTWQEMLCTCIHGVTEGLDSHSCPQCQEIADSFGWDTLNKTFIFTSQKQVDDFRQMIIWKKDF